MAVYARHRINSFRGADRPPTFERRSCPSHGLYSPWQRTLAGWRMGECPRCAAARFEAATRQCSAEKENG